jgi:hypothetical protein
MQSNKWLSLTTSNYTYYSLIYLRGGKHHWPMNEGDEMGFGLILDPGNSLYLN